MPIKRLTGHQRCCLIGQPKRATLAEGNHVIAPEHQDHKTYFIHRRRRPMHFRGIICARQSVPGQAGRSAGHGLRGHLRRFRRFYPTLHRPRPESVSKSTASRSSMSSSAAARTSTLPPSAPTKCSFSIAPPTRLCRAWPWAGTPCCSLRRWSVLPYVIIARKEIRTVQDLKGQVHRRRQRRRSALSSAANLRQEVRA